VTAWSALTVDTSPEPRPSLSTCTRAPSMPRTIGRPTPGPKYEDCTPGSRSTVSPSELALAASRRSPASTSTGTARLSAVSGSGVAFTWTACRVFGSAWRGSVWSEPASPGPSAASATAGSRASARDRNRRERAAGRGITWRSWQSGLECYNVTSSPEPPGSHVPPYRRQHQSRRPLRGRRLAAVRDPLRGAAAGDRAAAVAGRRRVAGRGLRGGLRGVRDPAGAVHRGHRLPQAPRGAGAGPAGPGPGHPLVRRALRAPAPEPASARDRDDHRRHPGRAGAPGQHAPDRNPRPRRRLHALKSPPAFEHFPG